MLNKLLKFLCIIRLYIPIQCKEHKFPVFYIDKHYNDMTRAEKRKYKRWLDKNRMWDGAIVIERMQKDNTLHINNIKQNEDF